MLGVVVSNDIQIGEDILTLIDQISEIGAGSIPAQELPVRPFTSTSSALEQQYSILRARIIERIKPITDINKELKGFCTHPEAVLHFTVADEHHDKLFTRQYPLAQVWTKAINEILERWKETGKIVRAPQGCRFNSPLLAVPKKDENSKMTGVRLCIDLRNLNKYISENDRFQIPHIPDMLQALSGKMLFAQVDCSEAFSQ